MSLKEGFRMLGIDHHMKDREKLSPEQIRAFLEASEELGFRALDRGTCTAG
jgi:hypothetical protein